MTSSTGIATAAAIPTDAAPPGCTQRGVALVAGGSGGIGSAVCRALAADGHDVALSYLSNVEAASATAAAAQSVGASTVSTQVDLTDPAAVHRWVSDIADSLGRIDVVIYAAGPYVPMRYISAVTPEEFRRQLLADTCAFYNVVSPALAHLRHHGGAIVAVSTPATRRWAARDLLSAAPKASIEAVVRGIAAEEGKYGVRANCVGVGLLRDGLFHDLLERGDYQDSDVTLAERIIALRRLGRASEVAEAVAFLASSRASWVTGQTLMVDGGYAL